jgi:predicted Zn-dependent protease
MNWIENGVVKNLSYDRFWAAKQGKEPSGGTSGIIMDGGTATIEEMIKATKRGLLVTNFWYIRPVDQMKVLSTGLTRDGLFLIENGKITKPLVNFRWNDSPAITLSNVMMLGIPERAQLFEQFEDTGTALIPPIMSEEFTMSSVAPGI